MRRPPRRPPSRPGPRTGPVAESPTAPPAPPEDVPVATTIPELPALPDAPPARGDVVLGPVVLASAEAAAALRAIPPIPVKIAGGPPASRRTVDVSTLGAPTAPPSAAGAPAIAPPPGVRLDAPPPEPSRSEFSPALSLEPSSAQPASTSRAAAAAAPGAPAQQPLGHNPFDTISAPGGPAPDSSSLLAVLASYVIPGGGAMPGSTLLLLVQLAVILAVFYAPRLGIGERVLALGRLGPRFGYRTVLARPG